MSQNEPQTVLHSKSKTWSTNQQKGTSSYSVPAKKDKIRHIRSGQGKEEIRAKAAFQEITLKYQVSDWPDGFFWKPS